MMGSETNDDWTVATNKRTKKKKTVKQQSKTQQESVPAAEQKANLQTPNRELLDPIFQESEPQLQSSTVEEGEWIEVKTKKKNTQQSVTQTETNSPSGEKKKRKRKTKKKKSARVLLQENEAADELRAREELKKGDKLQFNSTFDGGWIDAVVDSAYEENLTITYNNSTDGMPRVFKLKRDSTEIKLFKDPQTNFYLPLPKEPEPEKVGKKSQPKKKTKRKKKRTPKVNTKEEIVQLVDNILINSGGSCLMGDIANHMKDQLTGESWKKYKSRFGSLKKFLSAQECFIVEDSNGSIKVTRLEPEPEYIEEVSPQTKKVTKESSSSGSFFVYLFVALSILWIGLAIVLSEEEHRSQFCSGIATYSERFFGEDLTKVAIIQDLC